MLDNKTLEEINKNSQYYMTTTILTEVKDLHEDIVNLSANIAKLQSDKSFMFDSITQKLDLLLRVVSQLEFEHKQYKLFKKFNFWQRLRFLLTKNI